jgi:hypothetical protein
MIQCATARRHSSARNHWKAAARRGPFLTVLVLWGSRRLLAHHHNPTTQACHAVTRVLQAQKGAVHCRDVGRPHPHAHPTSLAPATSRRLLCSNNSAAARPAGQTQVLHHARCGGSAGAELQHPANKCAVHATKHTATSCNNNNHNNAQKPKPPTPPMSKAHPVGSARGDMTPDGHHTWLAASHASNDVLLLGSQRQDIHGWHQPRPVHTPTHTTPHTPEKPLGKPLPAQQQPQRCGAQHTRQQHVDAARDRAPGQPAPWCP